MVRVMTKQKKREHRGLKYSFNSSRLLVFHLDTVAEPNHCVFPRVCERLVFSFERVSSVLSIFDLFHGLSEQNEPNTSPGVIKGSLFMSTQAQSGPLYLALKVYSGRGCGVQVHLHRRYSYQYQRVFRELERGTRRCVVLGSGAGSLVAFECKPSVASGTGFQQQVSVFDCWRLIFKKKKKTLEPHVRCV